MRAADPDAVSDGNWEIYRMDTDGSLPINLSADPAWDRQPSWSPDGERIAFKSHRGVDWMLGDIYTVSIAGGEATAVNSGLSWSMQPRFSPDGTKISFTDNSWSLRVLDLKNGKGSVDDIDHLGNRRVRAVGELMENLARKSKLVSRPVEDRKSVV